MRRPWIAGLTAAALSAGFLTASLPVVEASSKGRRNTTIGLGAAAAYSLLRGKTTQGLVLGAGTAYAYSRYRKSRKSEKRRARLARAPYYSGSRYGTASYSPSSYRTTATTRSPYRSRYTRRSRTRTAGYRSYYTQSTPPGWSRGRKRGWRGRSVPPGHQR